MREEEMNRAEYERERAWIWFAACDARRKGQEWTAFALKLAYERFTVYAVVNS